MTEEPEKTEERRQVSTLVHLAPVREGLFHLPTTPEERPYLIESRGLGHRDHFESVI